MLTELVPQESTRRCGQPQTHGGEAALAAIHDGKPFRGLAAAMEAQVRAEFAEKGRRKLLVEETLRFLVAARLYYRAFEDAVDRGDFASIDHRVARFGWLQGHCLRGLVQLRDEESAGEGSLEALLDGST